MPGIKRDEGTPPAAVTQRHIIERPRLLKLLDETSARIILLIAPAGYGKTVLARQWIAACGGGAWCACTAAMGDPAALALAIARAAERAGGPSAATIRGFLSSRAGPVSRTALVEVLAEYFEHWRAGMRLVLDDYHLVGSSSAGDWVVKDVAAASAVPIVVASRRRPAWISSRDLVYGDVAEIRQDALAMTPEEVASVLHESPAGVHPIAAAAEGWPAVVGLAAFAEGRLPDRLPSQLHDFVACELFSDLSERARTALLRLAASPVISEAVVNAVTANDSAAVTSEAVDRGFITRSTSDDLSIHPLLIEFLRRQRAYETIASTAVDHISEALKRDGAWDALFELAQLHRRDDLVLETIRNGMTELLHSGRTETLTRWVQHARKRALRHPITWLAESHIALRSGALERSYALARRAAETIDVADTLSSRAWCQAAGAAYLADRIDDALRLFRRARETAGQATDVRDALWGETACAIYLGASDAVRLASEYEEINEDSIEFRLRVATLRLTTAVSFGGIEAAIGQADEVLEAVPTSQDPMIRTSFLNAFSSALVMNAQFDRARGLLARALADAAASRLDFAQPFCLLTQAAIDAGERRYSAAIATLKAIDDLTARTGNKYIALSAEAIRLRVRAMRAVGLAQTDAHGHDLQVSPPIVGEYLVAQALLRIADGKVDEALELVERARSQANVVEVDVLAAFIDAMAALTTEAPERAHALADIAWEKAVRAGHFAAFVYAYRTCPQLLRMFESRTGPTQRLLGAIMLRARDGDLARAFDILPETPQRPRGNVLSKREIEVLGLVAAGLTNGDIARRLFISEVTVKAHLRHVYEKLGVRRRTEAALKAQAEGLLSDVRE